MPHIHEKIDFTVEVLIVFNKRVLLRKHDKYKKWLGVGGHIELNEDPVQAAIREAKEEVGLDVEIIGNAKEFNIPDYQELIPPKFLNRHKINETHEHVSLRLSDKEVSEDCRWFSKEEIEKSSEIQEHIKEYALTALEELKE